MTIVVIPARGGSKRIPRKNLQHVGGTSLIGWSVREAVRAFGKDSVYVSTDDASIAQEARRYGARILMRPVALSGDNVTSEEVMDDALLRIECKPDDVALMVQCTSPFTTAEELRQAADMVTDNETVFAARERREYRWRKTELAAWVAQNHDIHEPRDGKPTCDAFTVETGGFYARPVRAWLKRNTRFEGSCPQPFLVSHPVDIDTPEDLNAATVHYLLHTELHAMNGPDQRIRAVVFDVDGVLTTGHVSVGQDSDHEGMLFSRRDGAAIRRMQDKGIDVVWVTAEPEGSPAFIRASKLGVDCYSVAPEDRLHWMQAPDVIGYPLDEIAYVGDSDTDAPILRAVGAGFAPASAMQEAVRAARYIVNTGGGHVAEDVASILTRCELAWEIAALGESVKALQADFGKIKSGQDPGKCGRQAG